MCTGGDTSIRIRDMRCCFFTYINTHDDLKRNCWFDGTKIAFYLVLQTKQSVKHHSWLTIKMFNLSNVLILCELRWLIFCRQKVGTAKEHPNRLLERLLWHIMKRPLADFLFSSRCCVSKLLWWIHPSTRPKTTEAKKWFFHATKRGYDFCSTVSRPVRCGVLMSHEYHYLENFFSLHFAVLPFIASFCRCCT